MQTGDRVRYIKTHEGHLCRVTCVIRVSDEVMKIAVLCDCGSELLLNPTDIEKVK